MSDAIDPIELARNMVQSPDNWPPMRVKAVAQALLDAHKPREVRPVGEARPSSDLVEGIARAISRGRRLDGTDESWWAYTEYAEVALSHISSLGRVVVPRERIEREGLGCGCRWTFASEKDLEGTQTKFCAFHHDQKQEALTNAARAAERVLTEWGSIPSDAIEEVSAEIFALSPRDERAVTDDGLREALEKISAMQWQDRSTVSELNAWPAFVKANARAVEIFRIADEALSKDRGEAPNNTPKVRG